MVRGTPKVNGDRSVENHVQPQKNRYLAKPGAELRSKYLLSPVGYSWEPAAAALLYQNRSQASPLPKPLTNPSVIKNDAGDEARSRAPLSSSLRSHVGLRSGGTNLLPAP